MTPEEHELAQYIADIIDQKPILRAAILGLILAERERCANIAEAFVTAPMDYTDWSPGPAADDRARKIAAAIRRMDD